MSLRYPNTIITIIVIGSVLLSGCIKRENPGIEAKSSEPCGVVSVQFQGPEANKIYKARITKINGQDTLRNRERFVLPVGEYIFTVNELINGLSISRAPGQVNTPKKLTLSVKEGQLYRLGARFIEENKLSSRTDYWQPIIWEVTKAIECPVAASDSSS